MARHKPKSLVCLSQIGLLALASHEKDSFSRNELLRCQIDEPHATALLSWPTRPYLSPTVMRPSGIHRLVLPTAPLFALRHRVKVITRAVLYTSLKSHAMAHWIGHIAVSFLAFLHVVSIVLGILIVHAAAYYSRYDESTDKSDYVPLYLGVSRISFPAVDLSMPSTLNARLLLTYCI